MDEDKLTSAQRLRHLSKGFEKHKLREKQQIGWKILEIVKYLRLQNFSLYKRTDLFVTTVGSNEIINLTESPKNGTHYVAYIPNAKERCFFEYFCVTLLKESAAKLLKPVQCWVSYHSNQSLEKRVTVVSFVYNFFGVFQIEIIQKVFSTCLVRFPKPGVTRRLFQVL